MLSNIKFYNALEQYELVFVIDEKSAEAYFEAANALIEHRKTASWFEKTKNEEMMQKNNELKFDKTLRLAKKISW